MKMSIRNTKWFRSRRLFRLVILSGLLCLLVMACSSSRKVGKVKSHLTMVENKAYSYKTPDGKSGTTNMVAFVVLEDGKEVPALPYANFTTADGTHHSQLTKAGQRVEMEPPLDNTELWRMGKILE
ncbi:MAG TPA: hypothetical protein VFZ40_14210 [Pyrinomonadaceae bacterium]